jgi:hypothetical protein
MGNFVTQIDLSTQGRFERISESSLPEYTTSNPGSGGLLYVLSGDSLNSLRYMSRTGQKYNLSEAVLGTHIPDPLADTSINYIDVNSCDISAQTFTAATMTNLAITYGNSSTVNVYNNPIKFENTKTKSLKAYRYNTLLFEIPYTGVSQSYYFKVDYSGETLNYIGLKFTYYGFGYYQHFLFQEISGTTDYNLYENYFYYWTGGTNTSTALSYVNGTGNTITSLNYLMNITGNTHDVGDVLYANSNITGNTVPSIISDGGVSLTPSVSSVLAPTGIYCNGSVAYNINSSGIITEKKYYL